MTDQQTPAETQPDVLTVPHQDLTTDRPYVHGFVTNEFGRVRDNIVRDLRALADRVERATGPAANQANPGFGDTASHIISDVMSALPNLGLQALVHAAAQADTTLLRDRLINAEQESLTLRANFDLPVTLAAVDEPVRFVRFAIAEENSTDPTEYGQVVKVVDGGYSVRWNGDLTPKYIDAEDVVPVDEADVPDSFTRM